MLWPETQTSRGSVGLNETRSIKVRFHSAVAIIRPKLQSKTTTRESASSVIAITHRLLLLSVTTCELSLNFLKFISTIVLGLVLLFVLEPILLLVLMAAVAVAAARSATGL